MTHTRESRKRQGGRHTYHISTALDEYSTDDRYSTDPTYRCSERRWDRAHLVCGERVGSWAHGRAHAPPRARPPRSVHRACGARPAVLSSKGSAPHLVEVGGVCHTQTTSRHRLLKNAQVPVKYHVQNGLMSYSYATVQCIRLIQLNPLPTTVSG